jgi:hypothetical protein
MNSIDTFEKRLNDETATVEKEIEFHKQQLEALNRRLEGLKRAAELFESEQGAISELLHAGASNGSAIARRIPTSPVAKAQTAITAPQPTRAQTRRAPNTQGRGKTLTRKAGRNASQNSGLTRIDMIAAVLKRHPRRTVRELIVLLNRDYHWQTTESAVTGHLYTRRDKFLHTPADRANNRLVTWSSK